MTSSNNVVALRPMPKYPLDDLEIDYDYMKVANHLTARIEAGEFEECLPTQTELAQEYGRSQQTVSNAIKVVAKRGLVASLKGKGVFLKSPERRYWADAMICPNVPMWPRRQLACILAARVVRGDWTANQPLPSEAKLVKQYGLERSTVRRTIKLLTDHGVVFAVQGSGTYVTVDGQKRAEAFIRNHKTKLAT